MSAQIPFFDIQAQHIPIRREIDQAIRAVLDSGRFIRGPFVEKFEQEVAAYLDIDHAIGVSSGTDALLVALMALDIGPGDEVITTAFTFCATAEVILRVGATPVFVDINSDTFNLDPALIEGAITPKTRAIVPVHLFGQVCQMDLLTQIARQHDLFIIEDAAQAMGATFQNRQAGTLGDIGCFSFFPTKNLGALGDGGLITTNNPALAKKIRLISNHGCEPKYRQQIIGGNFRLDAIQAAVLSVKLPHLDRWIAQRRQRAARYHDTLHTLEHIQLPLDTPSTPHTYNQFTIRTPDRAHTQRHLDRARIPHATYYRQSLHIQPPYTHATCHPPQLPHTTRAAQQTLSLPIVGDSLKPARVYDALNAKK